MAEAYLVDIHEWFLNVLPDLLKGLFIVVLAWLASRLVKRLVTRAARRMKWDTILWDYFGTVLRYLVLIVGWVSGLKQAGFPLDAVLTTFGISGIIIGLGARRSIANYFSGLMMLAAKPFKQGDLIEFGPPPQIGRVTEVKMTYTGLVTLDNVRLVVPNSVIWRNKIVNFSSLRQRAIRIPISVPYDVDVDWVADVALDVLTRHEEVLNDPAPTCRMSEVTAEDVKVMVVAWSDADNMNIFGDVVIRMRTAFETAGLAATVPATAIDLKREE